MWQLIGKWAVKLALYALNHPDQVKDVVDTLHQLKEKDASK